jgi:hypothetical protein
MILREHPKYPDKDLSQCNFVHQNFHMNVLVGHPNTMPSNIPSSAITTGQKQKIGKWE